MTNPVMHWTKTNGEAMTYGDATEMTPVPRRTYRCPSTARDTTKTAHTHPCKLTVDHAEEEHACICGKGWPRADKVGGL